MTELSPRLQHNKELFDKASLPPRYPPVTDQIDTSIVEELPPFAYNPSLIDYDGKLWIAARHHPNQSMESRLVVANLLEERRVTNSHTLYIPGNSQEDPRLFVYHDKLHVSFVESQFPRARNAAVYFGELAWDMIPHKVLPQLPGNDGTTIQKNYVFFDWKGRLFCIYGSTPEQMVYEVSTDGTVAIPFVSKGPVWPYGEIRGGTVPLPYEGKLLRFFHSGADTERGKQRRRYCIGAALMEAQPPFTTVAVSKRPILWGSEVPVVKCRQFKPMVVYVSGAVQRDWGWLLSCGIQDSMSLLARVTPEKLNL